MSPQSVIVLMPVRDDWVSAAELIRRLDRLAQKIDIMMVDDGSLEKCNPSDFRGPFENIQAIHVLRLRRNLGHQRAIAVGLSHIQDTIQRDAVLVMDSDGEDTPEGFADLLRTFDGKRAVFAERTRRSESLTFRLFYHLYRYLHFGLTGISVRVGNFSILPAEHLNTLVAMTELWNHYAATFFRSKLPFVTAPIPRGKRIAGSPKMNFVALVSHGLSAISVFGDVVGVRLLIAALLGSLLACMGIVAVVAVRLFTNAAVPGWATSTIGVLLIVMIQLITIAASFTFFMLSSRSNLGFVPLRDYSLFVEETSEIYRHD